MKFRNFSKVLLAAVVSLGMVLGLSSCTSSYTVGFLYVVGTAATTGPNAAAGIITGFKIDHNTGKLAQIGGTPVGSGGSNPIRAVIPVGGVTMYVLNTGVSGVGANISQFSIGGNGVLFPVTSPGGYTSQGRSPIRMNVDGAGRYLYVLDAKAPVCDTVNTGGDITVFSIDQSDGRLSTVLNSQLTESNACATANGDPTGSPLRYFPVPANAIDMLFSGGYVFTLHTNGSVYPYQVNSSNGQLLVSQSGVQYTGANAPTALTGAAGGTIYLLDNETVTIGGVTYLSQILPFTIGTNGSLSSLVGGAIANDPSLSNPKALLTESGGKFVYVANAGNTTSPNVNNPQSGLSGFVIDAVSKRLSFISGEPFSAGSGPQCLIEDPSNQYIYSADLNDALVTARKIDHGTGLLYDMTSGPQSYGVDGPASWCLTSGRIN